MGKYDSLSWYLHELATSTWTHMKDADSFGLPLNEETITEWVMLCLARRFNSSFLKVTAYNKWQEGGASNPKPTGADLEIWVETPSGQGITLRLQAKRIFWSDKKYVAKYSGIDAAKQQTWDLIKNSGSAIPLYLFYNWQPDSKTKFPHVSWHCADPILNTPTWGVSISPAFLIYGKTRPKPSEIPLMKPWGCFFCRCTLAPSEITLASLLGNKLKNFFKEADEMQNTRVFSRDTIFEPSDAPPEWVAALRDDIQDRDFLQAELERRNLGAVIHVKQTRPWELDE